MADRISDWVSITDRTDPKPLEDEPQNLRIEKTAPNGRKLLWDASELGDEDEYEIRLNGSEETIITPNKSFTFSNLEFDTDYTYEVRAIKK